MDPMPSPGRGYLADAVDAWCDLIRCTWETVGKANMWWTALPSPDASGDAETKILSAFAETMRARKRIEEHAAAVCAAGLEAGRAGMRALESVSIDRGTIDPSLAAKSAELRAFRRAA